jgi:hypothetical protein
MTINRLPIIHQEEVPKYWVLYVFENLEGVGSLTKED